MRLVADSDTKFCLHIPVQLIPNIIKKTAIWVNLPSIILVCQKANEGGLLFLTMKLLKYWNKWSRIMIIYNINEYITNEYSTCAWDRFCIFNISVWPVRNDCACTQLDHIIILHHFQVYLILGHNEIIWNLIRELSQIKWVSLTEGWIPVHLLQKRLRIFGDKQVIQLLLEL